MLVLLDTVNSCEKAAGNSRKEVVLQHVSITILAVKMMELCILYGGPRKS